jgi:hypothetical protein
MKTWKYVAIAFLVLLGLALIHPGVPLGAGIESENSASGRSSKVTCYSLHWDGLRRKVINLGAASDVSNAACWSAAGH